MPIPHLSEVHRRIREGELLADATFEGQDCDALLDDCDEDRLYESEWLRLHRIVEECDVGEREVSLIDDLRREAFELVFRATGHHEMSAHVSDDFGLLARASVLGINDSFLDRMWATYDSGGVFRPKQLYELPSGELSLTDPGIVDPTTTDRPRA